MPSNTMYSNAPKLIRYRLLTQRIRSIETKWCSNCFKTVHVRSRHRVSCLFRDKINPEILQDGPEMVGKTQNVKGFRIKSCDLTEQCSRSDTKISISANYFSVITIVCV